MQLVEATQDHLPSWLALRRQLWPEPDQHHLPEMQEILASPSMIAFLLFDDDEQPIGFIEGSLYLTASWKYGYVEGWYVIPSRRGQGWGWLQKRRCSVSLNPPAPTPACRAWPAVAAGSRPPRAPSR